MNFSSKWDDPIAQAYFSRLAQMDIGFQQRVKRVQKLLPLFWLLRQEGGSGFRMANMLRYFFGDYNNRLLSHGPNSLPSSFNVVQGFLEFNTEFMLFDLRKEFEHLVQLEDYFDWYTTDQGIPDDPKILMDVLQEGVIYSYDMTEDTGEYIISTEGSRLAIAGVSLVRHENELSIILLSGENPPYPPDNEVSLESISFSRIKGREKLARDESLSIQDRYMSGMVGFAKVLLLTRFNLANKRHDVRYLNNDCGPGFAVHTDDSNAFPSHFLGEAGNKFIQNSITTLDRYNQLFSALSSLIFLPIMFVTENKRVVESQFRVRNFHPETQSAESRKRIWERVVNTESFCPLFNQC